MSKQVNWEAVYKGTLRGLRTPKGSAYTSRKEQVQQAYQKMQQVEQERARFAEIEPLLRKSLFEHMIGRKPITIMRPLMYLTEGLAKSQDMDEIDRKFYNRPQNDDRIPQFEIIQKSIPSGTKLTFVRVNSQLGQWIFKSSQGEEIEIYDTPTIMLDRGRVVGNPGFWGLLLNTNIYTDIMESEGDGE